MTINRNGGAAVGLTLLAGVLVGGVAGLLYAPQSGARTRRRIGNLIEDAKERASDFEDDAKGAVGSLVERGRRLVSM